MPKKKRSIAQENSANFTATSKECKNCGHFDSGNYCSNCGQHFGDFNKPLKEIFLDAAGIISFDTSFFRTLKPFLFKPGFLTSEFLEGRRKKYMSPVRLYLFLSIVFFFIARLSTGSSGGNDRQLNFTADSDSAGIIALTDSAALEMLKNDSLYYGAAQDSLGSATVQDQDSEEMREQLIRAAEDPALYVTNLLTNISYSLFLLMPLFALLLYLLYIRGKKYYVEHLIFSINMHSFALLILAVISLLKIVIHGNDGFVSLLGLLIPVYFVIGMKRFYEQKLWKILLKVLVLGIAYFVLLTAAITGLAMLTLMKL